MNREETLRIMAVLKASYPSYYRGMSRDDANSIVALWADMFKDDPVELVAAAVKALIASDEKGYPPHIGAVKAHIRKLTTPQEMTEGEAWGLVSRAVRKLDWLAPEKQFNMSKMSVSFVPCDGSFLEWIQSLIPRGRKRKADVGQMVIRLFRLISNKMSEFSARWGGRW